MDGHGPAERDSDARAGGGLSPVAREPIGGRAAIGLARTRSRAELEVLLTAPEASSTLRAVCRMALGPAKDWAEVLAAAGFPPSAPVLLGQWGQTTARAKGLASARARGLRVNGAA
jgi:hypothetical protein